MVSLRGGRCFASADAVRLVVAFCRRVVSCAARAAVVACGAFWVALSRCGAPCRLPLLVLSCRWCGCRPYLLPLILFQLLLAADFVSLWYRLGGCCSRLLILSRSACGRGLISSADSTAGSLRQAVPLLLLLVCRPRLCAASARQLLPVVIGSGAGLLLPLVLWWGVAAVGLLLGRVYLTINDKLLLIDDNY